MKIFNHKQLLIILKPKYNYPIICKLIIDKLRKDRFKFKQNKLLNNLLKYKVECKDGTTYNRFDIVGYTETHYWGEGLFEKIIPKIHFLINTPEYYKKDNTPFKTFEYFDPLQKYSGIFINFDTLIDLMFEISVMSQYEFDDHFSHIKFTKK